MIGLATGALVTAVWQGILLAAVVWLALRLLPKTPAGVRFAIWFGVFLVVTALPLASVWPHAAGVAQTGGRGTWLTLDERWSLAIAAVWAAASLVRAVTLVVAGFRVRELWKKARPVELAGLADPTHGDGTVMNGAPRDDGAVRRRAQLCVSDEVDRPTVIGFFAPRILIPGWLLEKLTPAELEQIVIHEAGHLGRADDWMNLLQKVALVIFPLNPALAWVERRLCFERELAVDERVLRAFGDKPGAATEYAACLATVAEHRLGRRGFALALGALGRESELGRRVGRILRRGETMRPAHARLVLGTALLGLVGAAAGLERCPQLVGFAPNEQTVARADVVNGDSFWIQAKSVKYDVSRPGVNASHEVLMKASMGPAMRPPRRRQNPKLVSSARAVSLAATERQATLRDASAKDGSARVPAGVVDRGSRVVQWVVVTEWQGEDGASRTSRIVMTAAPMVNPAVRASRSQSDVDPGPGDDFEQVHPYAAVPVRGGWLVFQL